MSRNKKVVVMIATHRETGEPVALRVLSDKDEPQTEEMTGMSALENVGGVTCVRLEIDSPHVLLK